MVNFLRRPSLEVVQILLFLGNILQNDMNPSVTWNLLGMKPLTYATGYRYLANWIAIQGRPYVFPRV